MIIHLALSLLFAALTAAPALACPSDLDTTFGNGGIATGFPPLKVGTTYDIAVAGDGSIVTAGMVNALPTLVRYTHDGTLDTDFGNGGLAQLDTQGDFNSLAFQDDGSIVVAGDVFVESGLAVVLARFDASGVLDPEFGDDGTTVVEIGSNAFARDLLLRSDGRIVVSGQGTPNFGDWQPYAFFFTADGDPDSTIGDDGLVKIGSFLGAVATSAVEADDLTIVVSGIVLSGGDTFLARLTEDGSLDPAFGNLGVRVYRSRGKYEEAWRVGKDAEGRLYVSGNTTGFENSTHTRLFVRRVLPDGRRDLSYGGRGRALLRFHQELAPRGLVVTDDGAVTVPAWFVSGKGSFVARLTDDGRRDESFGRNGVERFLNRKATQFHHVALHDDGAILVTGTKGNFPLLLRLEGGDGDGTCSVDQAP